MNQGNPCPKGVLSLVQRFDMARSQALTESESLDLIRHYLKGYAK
ncbi:MULTISPECIES: hypothetical protein [unclassified Streptomyces]|nr:hypothetical protein [Streptomyces sp. NBC_00223]